MKKQRLAILFTVACLVLTSMTIDLQNLANYANQAVPNYITKDNTGSNAITDEGATLGRVLFYDKKLSSNNTIACASCHHQEFAFGDTSLVSIGVNGVTGRHAMRLVNARFSDEEKFFWDERASSLEAQSTMPIHDHVEMGYSGTNGDPDFQDLLDKLDTVSYYNDLFFVAFGDTVITEIRMQLALAQFIRSMQSFDAPYDLGRGQVMHDSLPFPNFTPMQNLGKSLFITTPEFNANGSRTGGGIGCASCHRPPEFDIDPDSKSNGVVFMPGNPMPGPNNVDSVVFRSPSLRDVVDANGQANGKLMHTGNFDNLTQVLLHYSQINLFPGIPGLAQAIDPRLLPNGNAQQLNMTVQERNSVIAFLGTLTGTNIYQDDKWSDPFDQNGDLDIQGSPLTTHINSASAITFSIFPNPATDRIHLEGELTNARIEIYDANRLVHAVMAKNRNLTVSLETLSSGIYYIIIRDEAGRIIASEKVVKT